MTANHNKRVLMIARDFPPASGAPALRIVKLAKYLPEYGWDATVVAAPAEQSWHLDPSLAQDIPADLTVARVPRLLSRSVSYTTGRIETGRHAFDRSRSWKLLSRFAYPDPSVLWAVPAGRRAGQIMDGHDAVITSGPPFSVHLAGLWLSRRAGLPWVADYRDNWSVNPAMRHHALRNLLDGFFDRRVARGADAVTVVSDAAGDEIRQRLGVPPSRIFVALNGFDEEDMPVPTRRSDRFAITYAGSLDHRRDIRPLLAALATASKENPEFGANVRLTLIGRIPSWVEVSACSALGDDRLDLGGLRTHREALVECSRSAVLLVLSSFSEAGATAMTSKLAECIGLRRPVLMLAPDGPGTALVSRLNAGRTACPDDVDAIKRTVLTMYRDWKAGTEQVADERTLSGLTRRATANALASALDAAVARASRKRGGKPAQAGESD